MAAIVDQFLMNARIHGRQWISTTTVNIVDLWLYRIRHNVKQTHQNIVECPIIAQKFILFQLCAIRHLFNQHWKLIILSARQHGQTRIVAWADDRLKRYRKCQYSILEIIYSMMKLPYSHDSPTKAGKSISIWHLYCTVQLEWRSTVAHAWFPAQFEHVSLAKVFLTLRGFLVYLILLHQQIAQAIPFERICWIKCVEARQECGVTFIEYFHCRVVAFTLYTQCNFIAQYVNEQGSYITHTLSQLQIFDRQFLLTARCCYIQAARHHMLHDWFRFCRTGWHLMNHI